MKKALVVLSGGQDSTLCLAMACQDPQFDEVMAVTFNYNQRHSRELDAARDIAYVLGVNHEVVDVGPILQGTSPLTNQAEQLEQYQDFKSMDAIIGDRVEKTFVPMRNALFLTLAANRAVCLGATHIYTGVCEADNANYPDCRQSFVDAQQVAINQALGFMPEDPGYIRICTPLMTMSKADSNAEFFGKYNFSLLALTHTAYDGQYPPIGRDHATVLREQGFLEASLPDPLVIRAWEAGLMPLPVTPNYVDAFDQPRALVRSLATQISELVAFAATRHLSPTAQAGGIEP